MTGDDRGGLVPPRMKASVPRDNIPSRREVRLSRGWVTVLLGFGAVPLAWLAHRFLGVDDHVVFALMWGVAALLQVPPLVHRYDWLAVAGLAVYLVSFALPAGLLPGTAASATRPALGFEILLEPPVGPLPHLPPGELLALAVGVTSWLANPATIVALAFYRYREATWAMVLGGLAVGMGAMELPGADQDLAHVAWLAGPGLVAIAGWLAREDY